MKFTKAKGEKSTIQKVWSDDKKTCFGLVGTIGDLLKKKILVYCDYPEDGWVFIPAPGITIKTFFGRTKADVLKDIP